MKNKILIIALFMGSLCIPSMIQAQNTVPASGDVGLGTNTPRKQLHVHSPSGDQALFSGVAPSIIFSQDHLSSEVSDLELLYRPSFGLATASGQFFTTAAAGDFSIRGGDGNILFGTMSDLTTSAQINERMRITNDGKIGIGTTTPEKRLDVNGNLGNGGFKLRQNSGDLQMRRFGAGDLVWKKALVPEVTTTNQSLLKINFGGDFDAGVVVEGPKMEVTGALGVGGYEIIEPGYALSVKGKIIGEELKIETYANWPDYVFEETYSLLPLSQLEKEIKTLGHLPNMPSAETVAKEGYNVSEMNAKLLEKVEELTLYVIQLNEDLEALKAENTNNHKN
ncbi:hypothetical protein POV27_02255 [Aureisphaera galaxeae]|uniref:hypothetical protein n=1 Tax=Aureisphaera galaxeae TaxID=1538023 RepID=UPI00235031B0|nr:hypothetical protein [Aureisphaera galaxeae]MDC8002864.1 hypothetical protein [Aureisphaera galaxeae]